MSVKTILLEFKVNSSERDNFTQEIINALKKKNISLNLLCSIPKKEDCIYDRFIYEGSNSVLNISWIKAATISRCTINLEINGSNDWPHSNSELQTFHDHLLSLTLIEQSPNFIPAITRGTNFSSYFTTSDDRLIQYGIEEVVFDQKSEFQTVQIVKTMDHGKILILDGAVNLAENDTKAYTHSLMNIPQDLDLYKEATVLILGGGDGGLLKCILEETEVKNVTMVDLDEVVMEACSYHLRSVCGSYLDKDQRKGEKYQVITGDAIKFMEYHKENKYDIIFSDLTDVPVDTEDLRPAEGASDVIGDFEFAAKAHSLSSPTQEAWDFIEKVLQMALPLLKPVTGRYYTHCNGKSVPTLLQKYEDMLDKFVVTNCNTANNQRFKLKWTKTESFVPSFMEVWVFYQVMLIPEGFLK